jgi:hypothetical protein
VYGYSTYVIKKKNLRKKKKIICYLSQLIYFWGGILPGAGSFLYGYNRLLFVADVTTAADTRLFSVLAVRLLRRRSAMMKESSSDCDAFSRGSQCVW